MSFPGWRSVLLYCICSFSLLSLWDAFVTANRYKMKILSASSLAISRSSLLGFVFSH